MPGHSLFGLAVADELVRPLPLELAHGNIQKEEDQQGDHHGNTGINVHVTELGGILVDLIGLLNDDTTPVGSQLLRKSLGGVLVGEDIVLLGVGQSLVDDRLGQQSTVSGPLAGDDLMDTGGLDRKAQTE